MVYCSSQKYREEDRALQEEDQSGVGFSASNANFSTFDATLSRSLATSTCRIELVFGRGVDGEREGWTSRWGLSLSDRMCWDYPFSCRHSVLADGVLWNISSPVKHVDVSP